MAKHCRGRKIVRYEREKAHFGFGDGEEGSAMVGRILLTLFWWQGMVSAICWAGGMGALTKRDCRSSCLKVMANL